MSRMRSLVGMVGGLTVVWGGALQQAAAGPVSAIVPDRAAFVGSSSSKLGGNDVLGLFEQDSANGISVPVSPQMSFGVGYEYLTEEDLVFEVAETGSLTSDYDSHRVMVRARWRF